MHRVSFTILLLTLLAGLLLPFGAPAYGQTPTSSNTPTPTPTATLTPLSCATLSAPATNLVENGDFEGGSTDPWLVPEFGAEVKAPGCTGARSIQSSSGSLVSNTFRLEGGRTYDLTFAVYGMGPGRDPVDTVAIVGTGVAVLPVVVDGGWSVYRQRFSVAQTITTAAVSIRVDNTCCGYADSNAYDAIAVTEVLQGTPTATPTSGPIFNPTAGPTPANCRDYAIGDGETRTISDLWTTTNYSPSPAQQFNVTAPAGVVRYGSIQIPPASPPMQFAGEYMGGGQWRFAYTFSATNSVTDNGQRIGIESILRVCLPTSVVFSPTPTRTPTSSPTTSSTPSTPATATATGTSTALATPTTTVEATSTATPAPDTTATPTVPRASTTTPTLGAFPDQTPRPAPLVTPAPAPTGNVGTMPDLGLVVPTLVPLAPVTATITISATAVIVAIQTMQAGVSTPAAAVATASAPYSWQSGQLTAAEWSVTMQPALDWLAILNPANMLWELADGPLWALAPLLLPLLPIIAAGLIVVFIRFFLWLYSWFLRFVDLVVKLIELIPGE